MGLTVACFFLLHCFACISRSSFLALLDSCSVGNGCPGGGGGAEEPLRTVTVGALDKKILLIDIIQNDRIFIVDFRSPSDLNI